MRCASRLLPAAILPLALFAAGCATTPAPSVAKPAAPATTAAPAEAPAPVAVQRDFAAALNAIKLGRYPDAERALQALTRAHPELSGLFANLGIVYLRQGKLSEAEEALKRAIALNPDRAAYHNQLGIVQRQAGQLDKARESYVRAIEIDPQYAHAHLNLGILYDLYLQQPARALPYYERYQALLPAADAQVNKWIVDLKQRRQSSDKTAMRNDK